jgi:uncharacterized protein DUF3313
MYNHVAAAIGAITLALLGTIASGEAVRESYDKVLIDDVDLAYDAASPLQSLSPAEARRIQDAARAALTSAAGERFKIVTQPGPGVVRLHASIAIDAAKRDKHFWRFTPVGFIKTRLDVAAGTDFMLRGATIEIAISDAQSGEPVPAWIDLLNREPAAPNSAGSLRDVAEALEATAKSALARVAAP